jgi:hypothetical protein
MGKNIPKGSKGKAAVLEIFTKGLLIKKLNSSVGRFK